MSGVIPDAPNVYRHKLTFADRCAIFVFYHNSNVSQIRLARAFNIDKKTVSAICDVNSSRYKNVHDELIKKSMTGMRDAWVTQEHVDKVNAAINAKAIAVPKLIAPSKMHNKGAYELIVCRDGSFMVEWVDGVSAAADGWYAIFVSPTQPYYGKNADGNPFLTAMECQKYWINQLNEE